jgi:hypothetical protein
VTAPGSKSVSGPSVGGKIPGPITESMLRALRMLEDGFCLYGRAHGKTISALIRRGLAEDADTITEAGRAAIAKATGAQP